MTETSGVTIRSVLPADASALQAFFRSIPEGDRTFFKEDVLDPDTVTGWTLDTRARRLVAVDGDRVAGYVAVIPLAGWSSHVGELRVVVDPPYRGRGVGRALARRGFVEAVELGLEKLQVEVVAEQAGSVAMFERLGFEPEALLRDQVRDHAGTRHDLLVLAHRVDETWSALLTLGVDGEVS